MTEPTDDELEALLVDKAPILALVGGNVRTAVVKAMREAFDKWGTPPAVAGEPVAWRYVPSKVWGEFVYTEDPKRAQHARDNGIDVQPVFTTPQPTQAQAGAVPLTDEQIKALTQARSTAMQMAADGRIPECGDFAAIAQNLDWLCDSFGIKGGQHG